MSNKALIQEAERLLAKDQWTLPVYWMTERLVEALETSDAELARLRAWIAKDDE